MVKLVMDRQTNRQTDSYIKLRAREELSGKCERARKKLRSTVERYFGKVNTCAQHLILMRFLDASSHFLIGHVHPSIGWLRIHHYCEIPDQT